MLVRAFLLAAAFAAGPAAASVIVVEGPLPAGAADHLARQLDYYGDYGAMAVGEGEPAVIRKLGRLGFRAVDVGPWPDGASLYVADPGHVPADAVRLHVHLGQILFAAPKGTLITGCAHHVARVVRKAWTPSRGFAAPKTIQVAADPRVAQLVAMVDKSNLVADATHLSMYPTRRADQPQAVNVKNWLVAKLQSIPGVNVSTETFSASYAPNVVAEIPGTVDPSTLVVLGAHFDSINYAGATANAPGADDNASGTAGILEAARILSTGSFEHTIRLVLFSAEEFGLVGSFHDAGKHAPAKVVGMLNMDMIAHRAAGDAADLDFVTTNTDPGLTSFCAQTAQTYVPSLPVVTGPLSAGTSDHQAYQSHGIPSVFFFEDVQSYSPVIHSSGDNMVASANDFDLARDIVKAFVACAAELAEPVDLRVQHVPLGSTADAGGPYEVRAVVTSLTASPVAGADLVWRVDGGPWQTRAMLETGAQPGEWASSIPGRFGSGEVEYYVHATDAAGHEEWAPEGANPGDEAWSFTVGSVVTIHAESFDGPTDAGWTHAQLATQDDWQRGAPTGQNGTDPAAPFSGAACWGNDLGLPGFNGDYQPNVDNYLQSPPIDCSSHAGVRLRYRRWLTVEDALFDRAAIEVNGQTVWQNPASPGGIDHLLDGAWVEHEVDVSAHADQQAAVTVRYRLTSDGGLQFGGWNVDDFALVSVTDGDVPSLVADRAWLSATQGGQVALDTDLGPAFAGRTAILAIGVSGSAPGAVLEGTAVPLNIDLVTQVGFAALNSPYFQGFGGALDPAGRMSSTMVLPGFTDPALVGVELTIAGFTLNPIDVATVPVTVSFGL